MKILIAGDFVPINSNELPFVSGNLENHFAHFLDVFKASDLVITNLECPLTRSDSKINKSGSHLKANPEVIKGISKLGINLMSIANNHIGDFSQVGVKETLSLLESNEISKVGVGLNSYEAKKPFVYKKEGTTIGVLSYADCEFGIAEEKKPGANPFNLIDSFEDINSLKKKVDFLIVLLHDGKEYYPYPSPDLHRICKHLVDLGADLIVCQHSHVIGAIEHYKSGTIIYGQGNFVFDYRNNRQKDWSNGFFIKVKLKKDKNNIEFLPFKQNYPGISKLNLEEKKAFEKSLKNKMKNVKDQEFLKKSWDIFIQNQKSNYLSFAFGHNMLISKIIKKLKLHKFIISNKTALVMLNYLRSRVHRESFISILENETKSENTKKV